MGVVCQQAASQCFSVSLSRVLYVSVCAHTHTHTHTIMNTHTHTHTHTHTLMNTYTPMNTHTYTRNYEWADRVSIDVHDV